MLTDTQCSEVEAVERRLDANEPVSSYERGRLVALVRGATGDDLHRLVQVLDRLPRRGNPTAHERPAALQRGEARAKNWRRGGTSFA